ncbi:MAG: hypothetical protein GJU74_06845, partial [Metallibacterium scheffleri]|nr:hypothetical protein [Metallibacterium scheffleri]
MKALLLLAALGLGGYASCAHARGADSMPMPGAEPASPATRADALDPTLRPAAATRVAGGSAARAPAQAQPAPVQALVAAAHPRHAPAAKRPARAAGGDSGSADPSPATGGALRPGA